MATTAQNFAQITDAALVGSTVGAAGQVVAMNPSNVTQLVDGDSATAVDKLTVDMATDGYAKHGAAAITLSGTTKVSVDLTNLATATASHAGDTTFATWNRLVIKNTGAGDLTIAPGSANPANGIAAGTTPTITVKSGGDYTISNPAGYTVDSTHKIIDITPTADGSATLCVGGA
jgi:hypothetical protein